MSFLRGMMKRVGKLSRHPSRASSKGKPACAPGDLSRAREAQRYVRYLGFQDASLDRAIKAGDCATMRRIADKYLKMKATATGQP